MFRARGAPLGRDTPNPLSLNVTHNTKQYDIPVSAAEKCNRTVKTGI